MVCPSGLCPLRGVVFVAGRFDDEVLEMNALSVSFRNRGRNILC
ncbi:hypothetical protein PA08_1546 [Cutibacterium modestum P08]|nr:hypothetical protein PA08_1546 [Cutibacterium modestum P08]